MVVVDHCLTESEIIGSVIAISKKLATVCKLIRKKEGRATGR